MVAHEVVETCPKQISADEYYRCGKQRQQPTMPRYRGHAPDATGGLGCPSDCRGDSQSLSRQSLPFDGLSASLTSARLGLDPKQQLEAEAVRSRLAMGAGPRSAA